MPWHLSKSDPRKVYDERHETVCVCQTAEQARIIVGAVTGKTAAAEIKLREPERKIVNSFDYDECCGPRLRKASLTGVLDALTVFTCPTCSCDWKPRLVGTVRHWEADPLIQVLHV